jgi:hypothetical protein
MAELDENRAAAAAKQGVGVEAAENRENRIDSFEPAGVREQSLGIQLTILDAIKEKIESEAERSLKALGERFLNEVVAESNFIAVRRERGSDDLFPKPRKEDVVQAFDHVINQFAQGRGTSKRIWRYIQEVPVLGTAVALTLFVESIGKSAEGKLIVASGKLTIAFVALLISFLVHIGCSDSR